MRNVVLFSAMMMIFAVGCTREKGESSKLAVVLPSKNLAGKVSSKSISAFETMSLMHVVINVTGGGIPGPILLQWDKNDDGSTAPASFEVVVPRGTDRLIQVLAVYEGDTSGALQFYYGDVTKTLSNAVETADVVVGALGGASTTISGQIMGRYFTSANAGPTGVVSINFQPGNGRPKMLIERSLILNGWFSVFALSNVNFEYELPGGQLMFGGAVSLASPLFDPAANSNAESNRRVKAAMPVSVRHEWDNTYEAEEAQIFVWGYWGNAAAIADASWTQRSVCKDDLSGSLTRMKVFDANSANWPSQAGLSVSAAAIPSDTQLANTSSPLNYVAVTGGKSGPCPEGSNTAADEFTKYLTVKKSYIDGNGKDGAAGFRGPFRINAQGQPLQVTQSGLRTISGTLLPGINQIVDGFRLFKKVGVANGFRIETPDCIAISSGANGFVAAGSGNVSGDTFSLASTINDAEATAGTAGVLCPTKAGAILPAGIFLESWVWGGGSTGGNPGSTAATKWKLTFAASPGNQVYNGVCVPLILESVDDAGNPANLPNSNPSYTLTSNRGTDAFYTQNDCSYAISSWPAPTMGYNWSGNKLLLYYKSSDNTSGTSSITATGAGLSSFNTLTSNFSNAPQNANFLRIFDAPSTLKAFQCYPINFQAVIGSGGTTAAPIGAAATINLDVSVPGIVKFYDNAGCSGTAYATRALGGVPNEVSTALMYFKYVGTSSQAFTISASSLWGGATSGSISYTASNVLVPGAPHHFNIHLPDQMPWAQCMPGAVELVDAQNNPAPMTAGLAGGSHAALPVSGGSLFDIYTSPGCASTPNDPVYLAADGETTQQQFYVKSKASGTGTVSVTFAGLSGSRTVTVAPEVATGFVMAFPGQTWTPGTFYLSGSALPLIVNNDYLVDVWAVKGGSGQIDTAFVSPAGTTGSLQFSNPMFTIVTPDPRFTAADNGHIQIRIRPLLTGSYVDLHAGDFSSRFGGLSPLYSNQLNISEIPGTNDDVLAYTSSTTLSNSNCSPLMIQAMRLNYINGAGAYRTSLPVMSPVNVNTINSTYVSFYNDSDCTVPFITGSTLLSSSQTTRLIYAGTSQTSGTETPSFNVSGGPTASVNLGFLNFTSSAPSSHSQYVILGGPDIVEDHCVGFAVVPVDGAGQSVAVTQTPTLSASGGPAAVSFYSDPACTSALAGNQLSYINERAKMFYLKASGVTGTISQTKSLMVNDGTQTGNQILNIFNFTPDL